MERLSSKGGVGVWGVGQAGYTAIVHSGAVTRVTHLRCKNGHRSVGVARRTVTTESWVRRSRCTLAL